MAIILLGNVHNFSMNCNTVTKQYIRGPFELLNDQTNIPVDQVILSDRYFDCLIYCTGFFTNSSLSLDLTFWSAPFSLNVWILAGSIIMCFGYFYSIYQKGSFVKSDILFSVSVFLGQSYSDKNYNRRKILVAL